MNALHPDVVVLLGDIFEGHGPPDDQAMETFKRLSAPLGVWAVSGNHEFHGGNDMRLFEGTNFHLLRNQMEVVEPGLVFAGVDDLTVRYRSGQSGDVVAQTLAGRPKGAAILLSHTPWQAKTAAGAGAGLMLSGHTHGGRIWSFGYLVRRRYPLLEGRYEVEGMSVIVSRGAGTWGRMRLWRPGEIMCVTLQHVDPGAEKTNLSNPSRN